jgi:uncharacterized protein YuzE
MKVKYCPETDAAYIYLKEVGPGGVAETVEAVPGRVMLDFDGEGVLVGVEVLSAATTLPQELLRGPSA